jgi:hypothetical protein
MVRRVIRLIVPMAVLIVPVERAFPDTWTNVAGDTIEATALEFDGRAVVFQRPHGEKIKIPLFSLATGDQARVKEVFNGPQVPADLQQAYRFSSEQLKRFRLLFEDGLMDDAMYAARREGVIRSFKTSCAERSYAEDSDDVQKLVTRLLAQ